MPQRSFSFEINPDVLRWARESAGQSTRAVAERLGVTERTLTEWEAGKRIPVWTSLRKLARQYQRPLAALLLAEPPRGPDLPPDFRTLPAARRELSSKTRLAIRTARWLQQRAIELHQELDMEKRFSASIHTRQNPEIAAQQCRHSLGIDIHEQTAWKSEHEAYRCWRRALEDQGILVIQFPFAVKEVRGFSLFHPLVPVIVTNESDHVRARIFTLFHEYAHILLQEPAICLPSEAWIARDGDLEVFCNRFAAGALIPQSEVQSWNLPSRPLLDGAFEGQLKQLARRYRVSKYVVLGRLRSTDRVSENAYKQLTQRWKSQPQTAPPRPKKATGGPSAVDTCLRQRGNALVSLVLDAARRGVITTHDAVTYLGVKIKDLDKLEAKHK